MDIRSISVDEIEPFYGTFSRAMGFPPPSEQEVERSKRTMKLERSVAAFDRGQIAGTAYSHVFELTLPGGATIPAAGVTAVSVATTHRRQGVLTAIMRRQLAEAKERGEPVAILIASESVIYGRFGYGMSESLIDVEIDTREGAFGQPVGRSGRVSFVDGAEADKVFPGVYDRWRRAQPGAIDRPDHFWDSWRHQRKPEELLVVWEDDDGNVGGYARYSLKMKWEAGLPSYRLDVQELTATSVEASAALWRYLLSVDLVRIVAAGARPVDEPLRFMLANPRVMRVTRLGDFLWSRILDVPACLGSRRYAADADLVLEVADELFPEKGGRYALAAGSDAATCERTDRPADIALPVSELGKVFLGGTSPSALARVGRVVERTEGALRRADAAFASEPKPWGNTWF